MECMQVPDGTEMLQAYLNPLDLRRQHRKAAEHNLLLTTLLVRLPAVGSTLCAWWCRNQRHGWKHSSCCLGAASISIHNSSITGISLSSQAAHTCLNSRSASASTAACCSGVKSASKAARAAAGLTEAGSKPCTCSILYPNGRSTLLATRLVFWKMASVEAKCR